LIAERDVNDYVVWLTIEKGRSPATIEAYRRDIENLARWMSENGCDVGTVHDAQLESYFNGLRSDGQANSSIAREMSSVRGWFGFLLDEGRIASDPTARLKGGHRGRTLPKPLGEEEVVHLLDSIPFSTPSDLRDRALLELLYDTGARVSEVVGVAISDLDFDEELILVTGKGSKQRLVPMGATLRAVLIDYLGAGGRSEFPKSRRNPQLFLNVRGGALTRQGVDLIIHKRALVAGIEHSRISAHVFRHSCATHMLAHDLDHPDLHRGLGDFAAT
jgi:site-specific recombinase XerD